MKANRTHRATHDVTCRWLLRGSSRHARMFAPFGSDGKRHCFTSKGWRTTMRGPSPRLAALLSQSRLTWPARSARPAPFASPYPQNPVLSKQPAIEPEVKGCCNERHASPPPLPAFTDRSPATGRSFGLCERARAAQKNAIISVNPCDGVKVKKPKTLRESAMPPTDTVSPLLRPGGLGPWQPAGLDSPSIVCQQVDSLLAWVQRARLKVWRPEVLAP
jgi:hypothetical protein